jgi:hypothetical protein
MSRPLGAKNKPRVEVINVRLSDLTAILKSDAVISVNACYAPLLMGVEPVKLEKVIATTKESNEQEEAPIQFSITQPEVVETEDVGEVEEN